MSDASDTVEAATACGGDVEVTRRSFPFPAESVDMLTSYEWFHIGLGISLAGGVYPLILAAFYFSIVFIALIASLLSGSPAGLELPQIVATCVMMIWFAICAAVSGLLWSVFVTVITLSIVYLFVWSLRLRGSIIRLGAFCGGLVGFVAVLPLLLTVAYFGVGEPVLVMCVFLGVGPAVTTVLGQIGGAWGGHRSARRKQKIIWNWTAASSQQGGLESTQTPDNQLDGRIGTESRIRFGIRHLLWIAVWLSLLLTLIRLVGVPFELILPLLGGWIIYQAFTLYLGSFLAKWLGSKWQAGRQPFHVKQSAN